MGYMAVPLKKRKAVSRTSPVFLSEVEITLVIESLLLAEEVHLAKAQTALKAEALDECYRHLQASEAAHALAERISGMGTGEEYCGNEKVRKKV
jgi:hypothetical protein